ncbi:TRAP transporter substrate-binding protein [Pseudoduganella sp. LjRoot289]|uniref:TRAP transporter substrate-binding protein n=1 Tax=Pseudoduganella sp. LjRoot289 TaxID=3342314 RepID=UPI003ECD0B7C
MKLNKLFCVAMLAAWAQTSTAAEVQFAYVQPADHPSGQGAARFAELVKAKTAGRIVVKNYSDGKLGSEQQALAAVREGKIEMMVGATTILVGAVKEYALFDLPFFFKGTAQADAVMDGRVGRALFEKLDTANLVGLAYWENGFRHLTNSKHSIRKFEDLQGMKIRVIPNPVFIDAFKALGATPVPLPFPEVYKALDSKVVDGQENPLPVILAAKFYDVQRYTTLSGHVYSPYIVVAGKKWWETLSVADRAAITEAAKEAGIFQRKISRELAVRMASKELKSHGVEVNVLSSDEDARMRERVKPVVEKYTASIGEAIVRQAQEDMEKAR